jgi:glycosidase
MMTTLAGTLYVFQGQELGMRNVPLEWDVKEYKDIETINYWKKMQAMYSNEPKMLEFAKHVVQKKARDHARTPMQWTADTNAGFCGKDVKPWMRVNDDYLVCNAEKQIGVNDEKAISVFEFWKKGLQTRKEHKDVFVYGSFELLGPDDDDNPVFAYKRSGNRSAWVVGAEMGYPR